MGLMADPNLAGGLHMGPGGSRAYYLGGGLRSGASSTQAQSTPNGCINDSDCPKLPQCNGIASGYCQDDGSGHGTCQCEYFQGTRWPNCTEKWIHNRPDCKECPHYNFNGNWCQACCAIFAQYQKGLFNCSIYHDDLPCKTLCWNQLLTCYNCAIQTGCGCCLPTNTPSPIPPPSPSAPPAPPPSGDTTLPIPPSMFSQFVAVNASAPPGYAVAQVPVTCLDTGVTLITSCGGVTFGQDTGVSRSYSMDTGIYEWCQLGGHQMLLFYAASASNVVPGAVGIVSDGPHTP
jgi:hypothetical protein